VPASQSQHPALIADREPRLPAAVIGDGKRAKQSMDLIRTLINEVIAPAKEVETTINQWECQHKFVETHYFKRCPKCGMFEHAFMLSLTEPVIETYHTRLI